MQLGAFKTTTELHDLGKYNKALSGIFSPLYDDDVVRKYVHEQFLEDSSKYIEKYQDLDHWRYLLRSSQQFFTADSEGELKILDIGSGGGNTVFPLMDLYPNAHIVASDLSVPILRSLKKYCETHYKDRSCHVVQLNAENIVFETGSIDLVVGGSLLHHVFDPGKTIGQCYNVLRPGGAAVFFEPFELGHQIIAMIFRHLLKLNGRMLRIGLIDSDTRNFFKALCLDFSVRKGFDKGNPQFLLMDDKWLFTRDFFEDIARSTGFDEVVIYPLHSADNMFYNQISTFLKIGLKKDINTLPKWAIEYIREMDEHFSRELRHELIIEGGIVLKK